MKNTHRYNIGLELFFSTRSSNFSGLNECTQSDVDELISGSSFFPRCSAMFDMRSAMKKLAQLDCCPRQFVPDEIMRLADCPLTECFRADSLRAFFCWLIDVARRNETDRVARVSALNTVASRFDAQTASFVRTGFALNNQRVVISRTRNRLTVTYAERDWGRVCVRFEDCVFPDDFPAHHIPGYLFSTEACETGDRYEFRFLVDTCFSDNDYCQRLMQPHGWHEFSFSCRSLKAQITACDYAGRLSRLGTPRAELVDRVCASLLSKHAVLGTGGLSPDEQAMLPTAMLITGCGGLLTAPRDQRWQSEQKILDALDNRYAMNSFAQLLGDSKCTELTGLFDQCRNARYEDDDTAAIRSSRQYAGCYELHIADGRARPMLMELDRRLCAMTASFGDRTGRIEAEDRIARQVRLTVEPQLSSLDFKGEYPHYTREKRTRTEYLSFMLLPAYEASRHGICSYYLSLAAAQVDSRHISAFSASGLDRADTNALDCQPELNSASRYGELASADDGVMLSLDADILGHGRGTAVDPSQLEKYIHLADRQFRRGSLPAGYAFQRLIHSTQPSSALRILLSTLPLCAAFSLALLIGYLSFTEPLALPMLTPLQAFGGTAVLCAVLTLIFSFVRRIRHAFTLWRYR